MCTKFNHGLPTTNQIPGSTIDGVRCETIFAPLHLFLDLKNDKREDETCFQCMKCDKNFKSPDQLQEHVFTKGHYFGWYCFPCNVHLTTIHELVEHGCPYKDSGTTNWKNLKAAMGNEKTAWQCSTCYKMFWGPKSFQTHKENCILKCLLCNEPGVNLDQLITHAKQCKLKPRNCEGNFSNHLDLERKRLDCFKKYDKNVSVNRGGALTGNASIQIMPLFSNNSFPQMQQHFVHAPKYPTQLHNCQRFAPELQANERGMADVGRQKTYSDINTDMRPFSKHLESIVNNSLSRTQLSRNSKWTVFDLDNTKVLSQLPVSENRTREGQGISNDVASRSQSAIMFDKQEYISINSLKNVLTNNSGIQSDSKCNNNNFPIIDANESGGRLVVDKKNEVIENGDQKSTVVWGTCHKCKINFVPIQNGFCFVCSEKMKEDCYKTSTAVPLKFGSQDIKLKTNGNIQIIDLDVKGLETACPHNCLNPCVCNITYKNDSREQLSPVAITKSEKCCVDYNSTKDERTIHGTNGDNETTKENVNEDNLKKNPSFGSPVVYICPHCSVCFEKENVFANHECYGSEASKKLRLTSAGAMISPVSNFDSATAELSDNIQNADLSATFLLQSLKGKQDNESFLCSRCSAVFPSQKLLNWHIRTHDEHRPHICQICHSRFRRLSNLKEHWRFFHLKGRVPCVKCDMVFPTSALLRQHTRIHTMNYKFVNRKVKSIVNA